MKLKIVIGIFFLIAALWFGACFLGSDKKLNSQPPPILSDNSKATKTLEKVDFIIDWQAEPTYLGVYYAIDSGEFEKQGYDVTVHTSWGAHQATAAIASGKYVIGTASGGATVLAQSNGVPIISLGVLYEDIPTVIYGLKSKSNIIEPKEIEGLKIGVYPGSITNNELEAFIIRNGLDADKITKVSLSGGDIPILLSGEVDAVLNYTELSPVLIDINEEIPQVDGERVWRVYLKDHGVKSYGLNLVTSEAAFSMNPDQITGLATAVFNGYENACNDIGAAANAFTKRFPDKDISYVKASFSLVCEQLNDPIGKQSDQGWSSTIDMFKKLNLLEGQVTPAQVIAQ